MTVKGIIEYLRQATSGVNTVDADMLAKLIVDLCKLVEDQERRLAELALAVRPRPWFAEMDPLMRKLVAREPRIATHDLGGHGLVFVVMPRESVHPVYHLEIPDGGELLTEAYEVLDRMRRDRGTDLIAYRGPDAVLVVGPVA